MAASRPETHWPAGFLSTFHLRTGVCKQLKTAKDQMFTWGVLRVQKQSILALLDPAPTLKVADMHRMEDNGNSVGSPSSSGRKIFRQFLGRNPQ
jgi:hypothetical protein